MKDSYYEIFGMKVNLNELSKNELARLLLKVNEKAIECEKSHKQIEAIKDTRYSANMPYPNKVLIKFKDGHEIWFKC